MNEKGVGPEIMVDQQRRNPEYVAHNPLENEIKRIWLEDREKGGKKSYSTISFRKFCSFGN